MVKTEGLFKHASVKGRKFRLEELSTSPKFRPSLVRCQNLISLF